jgi:hypothetical protein
MKVRLLTIGILVLLLCATVPMAASAGGSTKIKNTPDDLYFLDTRPNWVLGGVVGKITFNTTTGNFDVHCTGLDPNKQYIIGVTAFYHGYALIYPATTGLPYAVPNNGGVLNLKGSCGPDTASTVAYWLSQGSIFIITPHYST